MEASYSSSCSPLSSDGDPLTFENLSKHDPSLHHTNSWDLMPTMPASASVSGISPSSRTTTVTITRERMSNIGIHIRDKKPPDDIQHYLDTFVFHDLDRHDESLKPLVDDLCQDANFLDQEYPAETKCVEILAPVWLTFRRRNLFQNTQYIIGQVWRTEVVPTDFSPASNTVSALQLQQPKLTDPKPDFCLGLSTESISCLESNSEQADIRPRHVFNYLERDCIYAYPYAGTSTICYPSLILEAKSEGTGGAPSKAVNQAGVAASAALLMLKKLQAKYGAEESSDDSDNIQGTNIVFAITTYGTDHKIWVYYQAPEGDGFEGRRVGEFKLHEEEGSKRFLQHFRAIYAWTNGPFRDRVLKWLTAARIDMSSKTTYSQTLHSQTPRSGRSHGQNSEFEDAPASKIPRKRPRTAIEESDRHHHLFENGVRDYCALEPERRILCRDEEETTQQ